MRASRDLSKNQEIRRLFVTVNVRNEHPEPAYPADPADSRANCIAARANPAVVRLNVKAFPEIQSVAITVELRSHTLAAPENEVYSVAASERGPGNRLYGQAFWSVARFFPPEFAVDARAHRHPYDQALLNAHDSYAL
jgi:hypothetical protein